MCYKGQLPKIKMRHKGFKMKLRTLLLGGCTPEYKLLYYRVNCDYCNRGIYAPDNNIMSLVRAVQG